MPKKYTRGVYGAPLVKQIPTDKDLDAIKREALERAGKFAVEEIKREIRRSSWKRSPTALINSIEYSVKGSVMTVSSDHPAFQYLNRGVKPYQMKHLTKSPTPIPIILETGEVIFRNATSQGMADGKWQHPGIKGKHFVDRGVAKAKKRAVEEVQKTYLDMIRKMIEGD